VSGVELFLGGMAALAVLWMVVKAKAGARRAQAAAEIARVGQIRCRWPVGCWSQRW